MNTPPRIDLHVVGVFLGIKRTCGTSDTWRLFCVENVRVGVPYAQVGGANESV